MSEDKQEDKVFKAIKKLTDSGRKDEESKFGPFEFLVKLEIFLFLMLVIFGLLTKFCSNNFIYAVLVCLVCIYGAIILLPLTQAWKNRKALKDGFMNPIGVLLKGIATNQECSASFVKQIKTIDQDVIKNVHLEFKAEMEAFDKRIALVVGQIEKIGILPGLVALVVTFSQFTQETLVLDSEWGLAITIVYPIMLLFGVWGNILVSEMNRVTMLLESLIDNKSVGG